MSRRVTAEGEINYCQLTRTPDGLWIYPYEQGAAILSQALLAGFTFHRILEKDLPRSTSTQKRRVEVITGSSFIESDSTGTNYFAAYKASEYEKPVVIVKLKTGLADPALSHENNGPRQPATVLKHGASLTDFSKTDPWENINQPALTFHGHILADLVKEGANDLLTALIPESERLRNPKIYLQTTTFNPHQLEKLASGFGSSTAEAEYLFISTMIQTLNTLGQTLMDTGSSVDIPW